MSPILVLTHLLAASAGASVMYAVTLGSPRPPRKEPAMPLRRDYHRLPLVVLLASCIVITIGVQAFLARRDDHARDVHDRYRQCVLDASVSTLYQVLNDRSEANARLNAAKDLRADAQAAVILVAAKANAVRTPTPQQQAAFKTAFGKALKEAQDAEANLNRVKAATSAVLANQKPFHLPSSAKGCHQ